MSDKHYGIDYLNNTGEILRKIKQDSLQSFAHISSGTVLDLGCGTGLDVLALAAVLPEQVNVVGLDHDPAMIAKAEEQAGAAGYGARVRFAVAEAHELPFAAGSIAGIRAERLIQHLKQPELVFDRIMEVLMPGAPLVILEADWTSLMFYNGPLEQQLALQQYLVAQKINNGYAARRMLSYMHDRGCAALSLRLIPFTFTRLADIFTLLLIDQSLLEMKEKGLMNADAYNTFLAALQAADTAGSFACSMNLIMATGTR